MVGPVNLLCEDLRDLPQSDDTTVEEHERGIENGLAFLGWVRTCLIVLSEDSANGLREFSFAEVTSLAMAAFRANLRKELLSGKIDPTNYRQQTALLPSVAQIICNAFDSNARAEAVVEARLLSALPRQVIPEPRNAPDPAL